MQQQTSRWLQMLLLGLAIGVSFAACAGNTPTATPINSAPAPTAAQFRPGLASPADNLARLSSYRATYDIGFAGSRAGQPASGQISLQTDVDRQLNAVRYTQNIETPGQPADAVELVRLADAALVKQGEDSLWLRTAGAQGIEPGEMGILAELEKLVALPASVPTPPVFETWQGRNVQKYVFSEQELSAPGIEFSGAQGEMRVDVAGNYVVQYTLTATVAAQNVVPAAHLFDDGRLTLAYTLSHPDGLTISLPEGDPLVNNALTALPRPADADLLAIYPTLLEYTSAITPISATLYFGSQLPPLGWTPTITGAFVEKARLGFRRENEDITILIAPQPDSGRNKVTVSLATRQ